MFGAGRKSWRMCPRVPVSVWKNHPTYPLETLPSYQGCFTEAWGPYYKGKMPKLRVVIYIIIECFIFRLT